MDNTNSAYYYIGNNKSIDLVYYNKVDKSYSTHTHADHYILGIVLDGGVVINIDDKEFICEVNNIFTIPIDIMHAIKPLKDYYTMLSICVHSSYLECYNHEKLNIFIDNKLEQIPCEKSLLKEYKQLVLDGMMLLLESYLHRHCKSNYTRKIKNELSKSPEKSISIEELSKNVCISSFHMIREFKKEFGITPHQFQIQSRIRMAQRLLLCDKSVTEVAYETGFSDQSHFNRCFKKIVGMNPNTYKNNSQISIEQE